MSGKYVGKLSYWKLYYVENVLRVIINSILSAQIASDWWDIAVDVTIKRNAQRVKNDYSRSPWHTTPGSHSIYYIHLWQLGEIIRANSHLFRQVIPRIDEWIARIEQLRIPRNIVGHMNFPSHTDRTRIDVIYSDCVALVRSLQMSSLKLKIP